MSNVENKNEPECEGIKQYKQTTKEIKEIKTLIATVVTNSEVNKSNLKNLTFSFRELATANSLTHYKLFARTETLNVGLGKLETSHDEHVKNEDKADKKSDTDRRHKGVILVSYIAIGISILTMVVLAKQAGLW